MTEKLIKQYLFASDFDQTLSFNDSGLVLTELLGIPVEEFERKAAGMAKLNLVQQGAELAYLLLHDPEFRTRLRREHLIEAGKRIPLKENIDQLYQILRNGIDGYQFDFFVLSAAPVEIVQSALEGMVPASHIFGTKFKYSASGEIETIVEATAGYGKVARLAQLQTKLNIGAGHVVYAGDGSSDVHAMLHVNDNAGLTIAVSEAKSVTQIARRTVLSSNALAMLVPILEECARWQQSQIRDFFETQGFLVQEWTRVRTDWLTLRSTRAMAAEGGGQ
ncbi:MAG TPA: haloacid dehalogenase-like hydrolase [Terriglobales bacterium]|nr:haloacid dehalogenase-like hydrolase [Terriglobales bacterium]